MASRSSTGPNQPAKPMAPNPSTLSRSPVAGKARYSMISSQLQDQARAARARHADHHAGPGPPFILVEHGVAGVRLTLNEGGFAGAAGPFGARCQHAPAGLLDHGQ